MWWWVLGVVVATARRFGVSRSLVSMIVAGKRWP